MSSQYINCMIFDKELLDFVVDGLILRCEQLEKLLDINPCDEYEKALDKCRNALLFYNANLELLIFKPGDSNDR